MIGRPPLDFAAPRMKSTCPPKPGIDVGPDRVGADLPGEVDLEGRVDRDHVLVLADDERIVHVLRRMRLDQRIVVEVVVEFRAPEREGDHDLARVQGLASSRSRHRVRSRASRRRTSSRCGCRGRDCPPSPRRPNPGSRRSPSGSSRPGWISGMMWLGDRLLHIATRGAARGPAALRRAPRSRPPGWTWMNASPRTRGIFSFTCTMTLRAASHAAFEARHSTPRLMKPCSSGGETITIATSSGMIPDGEEPRDLVQEDRHVVRAPVVDRLAVRRTHEERVVPEAASPCPGCDSGSSPSSST